MIKNNMTTVLVTCVGSGVGQSAIDSLNLSRDFKIVGCDGNTNVYAHSYCDIFEKVPSIYADEYFDVILNTCLRHNVDIIIPGHDHELSLFAAQLEKFNDKGIEVIVSQPDLIEISRDKKIWFDYWKPLGCNIVPTFFVSEFKENPDTSIFPAIVKPSGGSASQGISIINTLEDLDDVNADDIIQPYLFPEKNDPNYDAIKKAVIGGDFIQRSEISIQLIFSKKSKFVGIFLSKNTLKNGVPIYIDPIDPDSFEHLDEILKFVPHCEKKGVKGPVNIQGRISDKGLFFFEMNMRFTGITGNRALLGFNEVQYLVHNFLGKNTIDLKNYSKGKKGVRQVACSTIPRDTEEDFTKVVTVLGAGSNLGQAYLSGKKLNHNTIYNVICRRESIERYTTLFSRDDVTIYSSDSINVDQILAQSDALINFVSALAPQPDSEKFSAILFLQQLSHKITKAKIPFILNISSQSVYDQSDSLDKTEADKIRATTAYAFQKILIENIFSDFKKFAPLSNVISLRLARILDPKDSRSCGFFAGMIKNYSNGETVILDKPLNRTNLIHINDVVRAINFLMTRNQIEALPEVLNLGGENISMRDYGEKVVKALKSSGRFEYGNQEKCEISSTINDENIRDLGYSNSFSVDQIIVEIANHLA